MHLVWCDYNNWTKLFDDILGVRAPPGLEGGQSIWDAADSRPKRSGHLSDRREEKCIHDLSMFSSHGVFSRAHTYLPNDVSKYQYTEDCKSSNSVSIVYAFHADCERGLSKGPGVSVSEGEY